MAAKAEVAAARTENNRRNNLPVGMAGFTKPAEDEEINRWETHEVMTVDRRPI